MPENRDVLIAGGFVGVRVFMTDQTYNGKMKVRKWSDTGMLGTLKVVRVNGVEGVPIAVVRLYSTDETCEALLSIMEYELPTNFVFNPNLTETFSALHIMQDQFLGFLFTNMEDRQSFDKKLLGLHKKLILTKDDIQDLKLKANRMDEEFQTMMAELAERELEKQAAELRKLLMMAGMELESDLSEPEVMEVIKVVL